MLEIMNKRVRASTPRTKTGCANCRQRRIKCDETEPGCERCKRSGWSCPGYTSANRAGSKRPSGLVAAESVVDSSSITQYSLPFKVPGSQEERRALHYFCNFAAGDLTGSLPSNFWIRTVLQRCQHDVPVRHAAAALGRIHRDYMASVDIFSVSQDSVEAYRKSVKALRNYLGREANPDRALVLTCSAVFFCFELVRGERRAALKHLSSGLDILNKWTDDQQVESATVDTRKELAAVFTAFDLQASMFDEARIPMLRVDVETLADYEQPGQSSLTPFETWDEAQRFLFPLLHSTVSFLMRSLPYKLANIDTVPAVVAHDRTAHLDRLGLWERRLQLFEYEQHAGSVTALADQRRTLSASILHYWIIRLLLLHCLQDSIMQSAPSFDEKADFLLGLAREVLVSEAEFSRLATGRTSQRSFSLHLGVVAPVFLIAMKTSRPQVLQAALEVLRLAKGRRESFYDAEQMVRVTEKLIGHQTSLDSKNPHVGMEELTAAEQPLEPALEWTVDDILFAEIPAWPYNEEARWNGYERLLAMTASFERM